MFDAIVVGSGMSGGISAKELCERGLKVLVIERGRKLVKLSDGSWALLRSRLNAPIDQRAGHRNRASSSLPAGTGSPEEKVLSQSSKTVDVGLGRGCLEANRELLGRAKPRCSRSKATDRETGAVAVHTSAESEIGEARVTRIVQ